MEQTIIRLAIGLVLLVAVNVVLGSLNALFDGTFDRIKCRNGVIKGIIIAACFVAFYVAGRLNPDIVAIDIDGETVNVATAANLAMVTAYVLYAKDVFSKLSKLVLSKTSGTPEQTGGTTPPALEEPADAAEATAAEQKRNPGAALASGFFCPSHTGRHRPHDCFSAVFIGEDQHHTAPPIGQRDRDHLQRNSRGRFFHFPHSHFLPLKSLRSSRIP